jgi:dsRNA-specific ribonuclease
LNGVKKIKKNIEFKTIQDQGLDPKVNYSCKILFRDNCIAKGKGTSKKKAEEKAAVIAVRVLKINPNFNAKRT